MDYRNDVVEDLQLPPALCVSSTTPLEQALRLGAMREYDMIPVLDDQKRPLGFLNLRRLTLPSSESSNATETAKIVGEGEGEEAKVTSPGVLTPFRRSEQYQVVTPDTGLRELEEFFKKHDHCLVTDGARRFVLGVATKEDLDKYMKRRYGNTGN